MSDNNAPQADLQKVIDIFNSQKQPEQKPLTDIPFFPDTILRDSLKPVVRAGVTVAGGIATGVAGLFGGEEAAGQARQSAVEGLDVPYFGKTRPFGAGAYDEMQAGNIGGGEFATRAGLDAAGSAAEMYSYTMAPLKIGRGFWNTIKEALPMALTFGAAKTGQAAGEGKGAIDSTLEGAGNALGVTAGFGLLKGGANLFANYGARALQSPAIKQAGSWAKGFAEKVWNALPDSFQEKAITGLDNMVNSQTKRTYSLLETEFNKEWKKTANSAIDALTPNINNKDLSYAKFSRSLTETMGNMFRSSNALYDDVKADSTRIDLGADGFATKSLEKISVPDITKFKPGTPEYKEAVSKIMKGGSSDLLSDFSREMEPVVKQPLTLRQIMATWERAMSYIGDATNEEKVIIRDFANGLYSDARKVLEATKNPLVNDWDLAYNSWKKASTVYDSGVLNEMRNSGYVSSVVDKMAGKMDDVEKGVFLNSIKDNEPAVRELIINELLGKVKGMPNKEGAELIQKVVNQWDDGTGVSKLFTKEQAKYLDDISSFMDGNFSDFIEGMKRSQGLSGVSTEKAAELLDSQSKIDVSKLVTEGRFDEIADKFFALGKKDDANLVKIVSEFTPEEKQVVGLSIAKDMFKEELPLVALNKDGTYNVGQEFADAMVNTWSKIKDNKALNQVMTEEQMQGLKNAAEYAQTLKNVTNVPDSGVKRILHGVTSLLYFAKGWLPGGISHAISAASSQVEKTKLYYDAIDKLLEEGLKKNNAIKVGDFLKQITSGLSISGTNVIDNE